MSVLVMEYVKIHYLAKYLFSDGDLISATCVDLSDFKKAILEEPQYTWSGVTGTFLGTCKRNFLFTDDFI